MQVAERKLRFGQSKHERKKETSWIFPLNKRDGHLEVQNYQHVLNQ